MDQVHVQPSPQPVVVSPSMKPAEYNRKRKRSDNEN